MFLGGEKERKIGRKLTYFFSLFSLFWGKYKKGFKACEYFDEEKGGGGRADLRPNWAANFKGLSARDGMRHLHLATSKKFKMPEEVNSDCKH